MRPSEVDEIAKAQERVLQGRKFVTRLREWMKNGTLSRNRDGDLLLTFERTLEIFERELDRLLTSQNQTRTEKPRLDGDGSRGPCSGTFL